MASGPQNITSKSGYTPSGAELPLIQQGMDQSYNLATTPQDQYGGQNFVGASYPTQAGLYGLAGNAGQLGQYGGDFANTWQRNMNASDISNNQNVQDMMAANASQVNDNLQRNIMPGIQQGAIQAGGMNSSRQGIAQGVAAGDASQALANANANTQMQAYLGGLNAEQGAMQQGGNLRSMINAPSQNLLAAGEGVEGYQNMALQDAMQGYYYPREEAENRNTNLLGDLNSFRYGTNYNTQPNPDYQSPLNMALGTAAGIGGTMLGMPLAGSAGATYGSKFMGNLFG